MNLHRLLSNVGLLKADMGLLEAEVEVHVAEHEGLREPEVAVTEVKDTQVANADAMSRNTPILFQKKPLALK